MVLGEISEKKEIEMEAGLYLICSLWNKSAEC